MIKQWIWGYKLEELGKIHGFLDMTGWFQGQKGYRHMDSATNIVV